MAQGMDFPGTVAPFILRGVALLGVDSVQCPMPARLAAWQLLAQDLDLAKLDELTTEITLAESIDKARELLEAACAGASWSTSIADRCERGRGATLVDDIDQRYARACRADRNTRTFTQCVIERLMACVIERVIERLLHFARVAKIAHETAKIYY